MHAEAVAAGVRHDVHEVAHRLVGVLVVKPEPVFDADGQGHRRAHGRHTARDQLGLRHEAHTEVTALHPVTWAPDVQVDLVVAPIRCDASAFGQGDRVVTAELQHDGMFSGVVAEVLRFVAVQDGAHADHLGVEQRPSCQHPRERAIVAVGAVHHGRDAEGVRRGARWRPRCRRRCVRSCHHDLRRRQPATPSKINVRAVAPRPPSTKGSE